MVDIGVGAPSGRLGGGLVQIVLAGILWGTAGLAVAIVNERDGLGAGTVSVYRMALGAVVVVALVVALRQTRALGDLLRHHRGRTVAVGLATAAYQGLYFSAVLAAGVGVATVVALGLAPAMVTGTACVRARRRPHGAELLALAFAVVGLGLVTVAGAHSATGERPLLGVVLATGAAVGYAATTVIGGDLSRVTAPLALASVAIAVGALVLAPWAVAEALTGSPVVTSDPISLAWLAWLGVATMAMAYALLYAGLRTTSSATATIATLLEPITAAALAAVVLGERLGPFGIAGGTLILLAIVVQVRGEEPASRDRSTSVSEST